MSGLVVACHQPDLLPYSGFFYKMAKADVFDLRVYDQYLKSGYQRRVKMRDAWAGVTVGSLPVQTRIIDVPIDPVEGPKGLAKMVHGRYSGSPHYGTVGKIIQDFLAEVRTDRLWVLNHQLILLVRDLLGITTPVAIGGPPVGAKNASIVSLVQRYGAGTYLSGLGAQAYMGDCAEFAAAGIEVEWSRHAPITGDSILSVLMDHDDPMAAVMAEVERV